MHTYVNEYNMLPGVVDDATTTYVQHVYQGLASVKPRQLTRTEARHGATLAVTGLRLLTLCLPMPLASDKLSRMLALPPVTSVKSDYPPVSTRSSVISRASQCL